MNTKKMNYVSKFVLLVIAGILLVSCKNSHSENVAMDKVGVSEAYETVSTDAKEIVEPTRATIPENLKIIKSASLRYKVTDLKLASKQVNAMLNSYKGYVSDQRAQNDLYQKENRLIIKIPSNHFSVLVDSLSTIAEFIDYENITSQDVTEEYVDVESRLKTKLEVKERYETILRKNAKTVEDILATEEKLGHIQEEIEAAQGRMKYLTNKVTFSTIELNIYETVDYKEQPDTFKRTFLSKIKEGFSFGWNLIQQILLAIIYIWPLLIIGAVVFYVVRRKRLKS